MSTQDSPSLYERLGGVYSIATVIDDFIDRIMVDPRLNANPRVDEAHHRVPPAGFKHLVTEMLCWAAGGPQKYTGRSMKDSHRDLMITAGEWESFLDDPKPLSTAHGLISSSKSQYPAQPVIICAAASARLSEVIREPATTSVAVQVGKTCRFPATMVSARWRTTPQSSAVQPSTVCPQLPTSSLEPRNCIPSESLLAFCLCGVGILTGT